MKKAKDSKSSLSIKEEIIKGVKSGKGKEWDLEDFLKRTHARLDKIEKNQS